MWTVYKTSANGLFWYLNLWDNWILELALKHEKEKGSRSVVKEAREFACEIDLDLETEFDGEMKNTENAQKLKRIAKEKGKKAIDTAWKSKPLHGQYPLRSQKADVDLHDTHQWLRSAGLKAETEGFIVAAQDQSLFTRNFQANILHNGADPRCRFCNTSTKTTDHFISECTILAQNEYTNRHNRTIYTGKSVTIRILKHPTNGISINHYLLWIYQKRPFSGTSTLELTEQYKLTIQM